MKQKKSFFRFSRLYSIYHLVNSKNMSIEETIIDQIHFFKGAL